MGEFDFGGFDLWPGDSAASLAGSALQSVQPYEIPSSYTYAQPDVLSSRGAYPSGGQVGGFEWNPQGAYSPNTSIQSPQQYATDNSGIVSRGLAALGLSGGGGGGDKSWMSSFFGDKSGLDIVNSLGKLGITGLGAAAGIQGMQTGAQQMEILKRQQRNQERMAAPASAAGAALTGAGSSALQGGPLPPQLETQVQAFADDLRSKYRQYLASIGMSDSSAAAEFEGVINQQTAAYREQLAQQLYSGGLQGITTALGPSKEAGGTAAQVVSGVGNQAAATNANLFKILGQTG